MHDRRVLIVEDDPAIRMLTRRVLEARGYSVYEVEDGPSALPAARDCNPDVVLLDVGLPGMDGFGVLSLLKEDEIVGDAPVLMVTAWAEPELVAKALDRGAHDYIRKPFDISDLGDRVDAAASLRTRVETEADEDRSDVATVDPLTSVANRHQTNEDLVRQVALAQRAGQPLSLITIDIDGLGEINDTFGLEAGDAVLRAVARRLSQRVRVSDVLGRWGGDEFVIVAPGTDLGGAGALAEDLRAALARAPLDTRGVALRVTASLGVAQWHDESHEHLMQRADAALTEAKRDGRNSVRLAGAAQRGTAVTTMLSR